MLADEALLREAAEALRKAKKDAERYRFVRDNGCLDYWDLHGDKTIAAAGDAIDRAIDEAIAERALTAGSGNE